MIPEEVLAFVGEFHRRNAEVFVVGGALRSALLDSAPADFDFATSATASDVMNYFHRVIPTGIDHGTVTVLFRGFSFEVTTYRTETTYSDHRRPDQVAFGVDIFEDLKRRDFTMNAMALDPVRKLFLDPHDGENDLANRLVRAIGRPTNRFSEDALRMLRAVRFASQLDFKIEDQTRQAIATLADDLSHVSVERITEELNKILMSRSPARGLAMLRELNLLEVFLPELAAAAGVEQRGEHRFDVFEHSIRACQNAPAELHLRLAALFHDIGKPTTLEVDADGQRTFHGHDKVGASLAEEILRRLRYPTSVVKRVVHLVRHHMFSYTPDWTDAAVRRFIARVGEEQIRDIIELRRADSAAVTGGTSTTRGVDELLKRVNAELEAKRAFTIRDLAINGNDLKKEGIPHGPALGVVLRELLQTVVDDPSQNERERLLLIARRLYSERVAPEELEVSDD